MKTGAELITEERSEQVEKHGFSAEHDSHHNRGELLDAALQAMGMVHPNYFHPAVQKGYYWPWEKEYFLRIKKKNDIEKLVVAGAFIAAEIDRLQSQS